MNENELIRDVLHSINTYPNRTNRKKVKCDSFVLNKPYSYIESIAVAIIKIHNDEEDYIEEMKRDENLFEDSKTRVKFIESGRHVSFSAYRRFKYPHTDESITEFISNIPR